MNVPTRSLLAVAAILAPAACAPPPVAPPASAPPAPAAVATSDPWVAPADAVRPALRYDRFETFGIEDGLPTERITTLLAEGPRISVGTEAGLAVRDDGGWTVIGEAQGLSHPYVTSLARDPATGDLWVSTLRGLNRISGGHVKTYLQTDSGLMNDVVYHVIVQDGLVWAATAAGASILDPATGAWDLYDTGNSIMHEPWCYALAAGPGRTWIGVWGGGVIEREHATGAWREYRDPDGEMEIDVLRDDGPIHEVTSFVAYDAGVLWQGTYFGLSRYDGRRWQTYVAKDTGIPGDFIAHVHALGRTVFIASDEGLGVFDGTTCVTYRHAPKGGADVIVWKDGVEVERAALATGPPDDYLLWVQGGEAEVWFATARGLCHGMTEAAYAAATGGIR